MAKRTSNREAVKTRLLRPGGDVHPLIYKKFAPIENFHEWLKLWAGATTLPVMLGLLHGIGDVSLGRLNADEPDYDSIDFFIFLLHLADGWSEDEILCESSEERHRFSVRIGTDHNDNAHEVTLPRLRQIVARKAFSILAMRYFRMTLKMERGEKDEFSRIWKDVVTSERLLPEIQRFFRLQKMYVQGEEWLVNFCPRFEDDKAKLGEASRQFLLNLARYLWDHPAPHCPYFSQADVESGKKREWETKTALNEARLDAAKPWMLRVLLEMGEFQFIRRRLAKLDKPCLEVLREYAMQAKLGSHDHPVSTTRLVASLDEARLAGSHSAWLLYEREHKDRETERLKAILNAEQEKAAAEEKLKSLTGK